MINTEVEQQLHEHLDQLPEQYQRQVLAYAQALAADNAKGVPGPSLLQFAGFIGSQDLALMTHSIQSDCGQVAVDEW